MDDEILKRSFCVEISHFPGVDDAWIEDRAMAIGTAINERLIHKLEWGRVYGLTDRNGIGLAFLIAKGFEQDSSIVSTFMEIVFQATGIKTGRGGRAFREGGMPRVCLGPRYPAEFFESRGEIEPVSPVIHSDHGTSKRSGTQESGWEGA